MTVGSARNFVPLKMKLVKQIFCEETNVGCPQINSALACSLPKLLFWMSICKRFCKILSVCEKKKSCVLIVSLLCLISDGIFPNVIFMFKIFIRIPHLLTSCPCMKFY